MSKDNHKKCIVCWEKFSLSEWNMSLQCNVCRNYICSCCFAKIKIHSESKSRMCPMCRNTFYKHMKEFYHSKHCLCNDTSICIIMFVPSDSILITEFENISENIRFG
jgi:DNA-directed RNA polymerase subunit RPC12/RpoP